MASRENAIKNNLNDRARKVGQFDELTTQDIDALIAFYDYSCLNCGKKPASSIDHVKPLIAGGSNTRDNLQLLCVECNKAKQDTEIDYRNGKVVPADFLAPSAQEKTYKKHDWETIEKEYITSDSPVTTTELSTKYGVPYPTIRDYAVRHDWVERRQEFRRTIVETAHNEVVEILKEPLKKHELSARTTLFQVIEDAVSAWQANPKPSTRDLAELLKLGLVAQGGITERTAHVDAEHDDSAILSRINKVFDGGEEERTYSPVGLDGEEAGAGYSDAL